MKTALAHKIPNQNRSNAGAVQGKGVSRPAPNSVVQRQVIVEDDSGNIFNSKNFQIATKLFLSTVKGQFFAEIKKAGSELELLIFAEKEDSIDGGITAGVTRAMVRTKPENLKLEKEKDDEDAFSSVNYPETVNWDSVTKDSPFRIVIGINMSKEAHNTPEDMAATMLHEWYVHAVNWENLYKSMRQSENVKDVFKDFNNDKVALDEHQNYVEGKTGMDDAMGEIISLVASLKEENFIGEMGLELKKYLNAFSESRIRKIQDAIKNDIIGHEEMTKTKFDINNWPNLKKEVTFEKKIAPKKLQEEKKRERKDPGDDLKKEKEQVDVLTKNSKKKKNEPVKQDLLTKNDN